MGSGKSTFLAKLEKAGAEDFKAIDLDEYIYQENVHDLSAPSGVAGLIALWGWEKFRQIEVDSLRHLICLPGNSLISLGGGALHRESLEMLRQNPQVKIVWLNLTFEQCWDRVKDDKHRPLVLQGKDAMHLLYQKRADIYAQADLILIDSDVKVIENWQQLRSRLSEA